MSRITYLLGAGASAGSLPTVDKFAEALPVLLNHLNACLKWVYGNNASPEKQKIIQTAYNDLKVLQEGCSNHRSVDTFAKMLFLTAKHDDGGKKYRQVKCSIILFFELYHFYNTESDKRYDAFLATILKSTEPNLPTDINILSWNYDYEFEKAYLKYASPGKNIHTVCSDLNIIHKNNFNTDRVRDRFGIIKINGTAGFYNTSGEILLGLNCYDKKAGNNINGTLPHVMEICKEYYKRAYDSMLEPAISFSWDDDNGKNKIENEIEYALKDTQILIVIGYSFPYFNREIDSKIINNIRYGNTKVYIQDFKAEELIETAMELKNGSSFEHKAIKNCDQFYMRF